MYERGVGAWFEGEGGWDVVVGEYLVLSGARVRL
jgi:hypothetical protein